MSIKEKVVILVVVVGGFEVYEKFYSEPTNQKVTTQHQYTSQKKYTEGKFHCDGRQHCSQMNSRAEAEYFTEYCPDTKMDGDMDGIPCENDSRW